MFRIQRVLLVGDVAVYRRLFNEAGVLKYFVHDVIKNEHIQDFKTKNQATKFALANNNLYGGK